MLQIVCPVCLQPQASRPIERDGKPWFESYCKEHGPLSYFPKFEWTVTPAAEPAAAPVKSKPRPLAYDAATFATVVPVDDVFELHVAETVFLCNEEDPARSSATKINAGAQKVAAEALRRAADAEIEMAQTLEMTLCRSEESPIERNLNRATRVRIDFYRASAQRLRVRADDIEKGE